MATNADRLHQGAQPQRDDELLTRYMRALLRTGRIEHASGQMVRTCINAPEGHVEIDL